ncbi:glutamyl-tRNA(Gln) amidotransferase subunit C, mitochondrial isoform X2 [Zootermopsis nevadensis]|uniref:Glutamyl-tRNA(Gln) amidotransferase subunit C, mitochondrial n=2 Tax=Zootermopsis nevadensis TaxID=136037 RepID=A0A067QPA1_ZOONE|nr:glutamyl-tRNA(Gln) amidotransferase subunit C, mitochondrial isoform X2 [Zootermopsis nevadensis]XP_021936666.1 glutamyl-tRNA(Gln) amidotransferase subunit C, mitochondrial isoform X2 [Zootermopsis nevadensis]XP_021936668.1 glutamyl-tRNA(Gln) amidotransferase subunit C, mitochondrial isoform X2 [Zootermopsis nevadensis]XP_021936669.1 glutamyl-tRNA(Gln) amidotransferase subunit C, mitochondrial isoform X2 [Zootermopsis nevadensis]KDR10286.1 GatC-like protein [Zootermopsis nevadensis]
MNRLLKHNTTLIKFWCLQGNARLLNSKIPPIPVVKLTDENNLPPQTKINQETIELLERLSLVDFANKRGIERLEDAIKFADLIRGIDTSGVEPMISVLEDRTLYLRDDIVTEGNCRKEVMSNAAVTEEEYFVAPQGNIPLIPRDSLLNDNKSSKQK